MDPREAVQRFLGYLMLLGSSLHTIRCYENDLKRFVAYAERTGIPLAQIDRTFLRAYLSGILIQPDRLLKDGRSFLS